MECRDGGPGRCGAPAADLVVTPAGLGQLVGGLEQDGSVKADQANLIQSAITARETVTTSSASASALSGLRSDIAAVHRSAGTFLGMALTLH